mmetsp:Transcript_18915/g.39371  ORF Transcript_18915/g.39371 Transcript_18915/m.39371 type:complete len:301 (+) Transcript_18915:836-1738(+)
MFRLKSLLRVTPKFSLVVLRSPGFRSNFCALIFSALCPQQTAWDLDFFFWACLGAPSSGFSTTAVGSSRRSSYSSRLCIPLENTLRAFSNFLLFASSFPVSLNSLASFRHSARLFTLSAFARYSSVAGAGVWAVGGGRADVASGSFDTVPVTAASSTLTLASTVFDVATRPPWGLDNATSTSLLVVVVAAPRLFLPLLIFLNSSTLLFEIKLSLASSSSFRILSSTSALCFSNFAILPSRSSTFAFSSILSSSTFRFESRANLSHFSYCALDILNLRGRKSTSEGKRSNYWVYTARRKSE